METKIGNSACDRVIMYIHHYHMQWGYNHAIYINSIVGTAYAGGRYPPGTGSVYLMNVLCGQTHTSLLECPFQSPFIFCGHPQDVGVKCYESGNIIRILINIPI